MFGYLFVVSYYIFNFVLIAGGIVIIWPAGICKKVGSTISMVEHNVTATIILFPLFQFCNLHADDLFWPVVVCITWASMVVFLMVFLLGYLLCSVRIPVLFAKKVFQIPF